MRSSEDKKNDEAGLHYLKLDRSDGMGQGLWLKRKLLAAVPVRVYTVGHLIWLSRLKPAQRERGEDRKDFFW